jgi:hypothetical protein
MAWRNRRDAAQIFARALVEEYRQARFADNTVYVMQPPITCGNGTTTNGIHEHFRLRRVNELEVKYW